MNHQQPLRIMRRPEVLTQTGLSKSTLQLRINNGLFCPPVSLGNRAVGFISSEINAVLNALFAEKSNDEIRVLVLSLIEQRQINYEGMAA